MDFDHLRYFQTLAACGNYTAAAKRLFISQPALSYAMAQLEKRIELKLFERTSHGVVLTPAGEEYLTHVDRALEELEIGKARARVIMGGAQIIRISLDRLTGAIFLPGAIMRFKRENESEDFEFSLRPGVTSEIISDLEDGKSGIGLCSQADHPAIESFPVAKQRLVVIVPADHELAGRKSVNLIEVARYTQVGFSPTTGLRRVVDDLFAAAGVVPHYLSEEREDYTVAGMVAAGFGIAVVPRLAIFEQLDIRCLEIDNENNGRTYCLAYLKEGKLTQAERRFIDFTRREVEAHGLANIERG